MQSTRIQSIVTSVNICALIFIIVAGGYLGFKTAWIGYKLPTGYFPFGVDGMIAGSATAFLHTLVLMQLPALLKRYKT
jgi:solute carrier family 7 (cationic amino acid transporter), member 1